MQVRKFTPAELESLFQEAASWFQQQRDFFLPKSVSLDDSQKGPLRSFFPASLLDRVRVVDASHSGDSIPYPPFYERVRAGGERIVPDAAHMTAVAFGEVIVFNRPPSLRTLFHNLVHILQADLVGPERFIRGYLKILNESGLWMVVPFEEQAYQLDARYTSDPSDIFSVEAEVRDWIKRGRY